MTGIPYALGGYLRTLYQRKIILLCHERFIVTVIYMFLIILQYQTPHKATGVGHVT